MAASVPPVPTPLPPEGLPPVKPPSGKFIAQLFLVPLLIVCAIVVLFFGVPWLVSLLFGVQWGWMGANRSSPQQFLRSLDETNPDVRWRAAQDLAQVLLRDDNLAADPKFCLDLAERLQNTLKTSDAAEQARAERLRQLEGRELTDEDKKALAADRHTLEGDRNYVLYLGACLGNFSVPAGLPVLRDLAAREGGAEPKLVTVRRWRALFALANLGESLKRFDRLPPDRQTAALATLEQEAAGTSDRARWAKAALAILSGRQGGKPTTQGLAAVLVQCSRDDNPFIRKMAVFAMTFWEGDPRENGDLDRALAERTYDDGHGQELLDPFYEDEQPQTQAFTRPPGLGIRYTAMVALARRGSDKVRLPVLAEMLDEAEQTKAFRRRQKDGSEVADEGAAYESIVNTLRAAAELHRRRPGLDLSELRPAVDALAGSGNKAVRAEAERTRIILDKNE